MRVSVSHSQGRETIMEVVTVNRLFVLFLTVCIFQATNAATREKGTIMMEIGAERSQDREELESTYVKQHAQHLQHTTHNPLVGNAEADGKLHAAGDGKDENYVDVMINLNNSVNNVGPMFVGVTLDSSLFRQEWKTFNTSSKQLQSLAKGIAPAFLRVGGSAADFFIFNDTAEKSEEIDGDNLDYDYVFDQPLILNYTVTAEDWKRLNVFIEKVGWHLIFDFNEFLRKGDRWNPVNARKLLTFSQEQNFSIPVFQLGNEPNAYHHNFNFTIPGSQLAKDMQQLRSLLAEFPAYHDSYIIGPDVTRVTKGGARKYLEDFLKFGGQDIVSAITLHHYYFNAQEHGASLKDFIDTKILNSLVRELAIAQSIAHDLAPEKPLWFSETSSVSGGGLAGVSDGYAAGFMWLDKLGLSALYGLKAVLRQCFYNGNYALISHDFDPYPDYFLTVLYKRLVQGSVFNVTTSTDKVRMYASCANPSFYPKGGLTVYILNVRNKSTTLNFSQFVGHQYELYLLTPGDKKGLRSRFVALNGQKLVMDHEDLPPLRPRISTGSISFPAFSFGFVVIPQAGVHFCH